MPMSVKRLTMDGKVYPSLIKLSCWYPELPHAWPDRNWLPPLFFS